MDARPVPRAHVPGTGTLSDQERAALVVLWEAGGRVVGRRELARAIGLADRNDRRCDSLLVGLRRVLGPDAIITVRSRGWMLDPTARDAARRHIAPDP